MTKDSRGAVAPKGKPGDKPVATDFSKLESDMKDDHRVVLTGGNSRYNFKDGIPAWVKKKLAEREGKTFTLSIETAKDITQYTGKANDENFIYGFQMFLKRLKDSGNDAGFVVGIRANAQRVSFSLPKKK